jgi:hypothetical protein
MSRLHMLLVTLALLGLVSSRGPVSALAQASTTTVVFRNPVSEVASLVCVSEPVLLTGEIQTVFHSTQDPRGGETVVQASTSAALQGVGLVTGQVYQIPGTPYGNLAIRYSGPFPRTETYGGGTTLIVGRGQPNPGPIFQIFILHHVTYDANGVPIRVVDEFREQCL